MRKPRIQDIAEAAGVSPATVTRVLRGNGYASDEKRELVLQTAKDLGYDFTQRPVKNSVPQVLIISHPSHPSNNWLFSNILEHICLEIQEMGWHSSVFYITRKNADQIYDLLENTQQMNLKGIICTCLDFSENLASLHKLLTSLPVPLVMIERFPDIFGLNKIMINAKESVFLAVRHLYKHGHRKIAFFSPDSASEVEHARIEGFKSAVSAMTLEKDAHFIHIQDYRPDYGRQALESYIGTYGLPTAIICADPVMVGISQYLYDHKIQIPEDVSLIGLDDTIAGVMTPPLTSVAFPVAEIARTAIQFLLEEKDENSLTKTISLSTYLIERDSVAPPREE